jgi:hypothetical protein
LNFRALFGSSANIQRGQNKSYGPTISVIFLPKKERKFNEDKMNIFGLMTLRVIFLPKKAGKFKRGPK